MTIKKYSGNPWILLGGRILLVLASVRSMYEHEIPLVFCCVQILTVHYITYIVFIVLGSPILNKLYILFSHMIYFMSIGCCGTFIGQTFVKYCIKEYGRRSLIVFSVSLIMTGAILLMGINGVIHLFDGISWEFQSLC